MKMLKKRRINMKNKIMKKKSNKKANFRKMKKSMMTDRKLNFKIIK